MNTFLQRLAALTLLLLVAAPSARAQGVTTSALNGTVTDTQGATLPGVNVIAVHQPSGTRYGVATRSDGRYNLRNLRVGGPYTIQFSYIGFTAYEETGLTLALGEDRLLDVTLREESLQAGEVEVTAERGQLLSAENKGAGTNVSQEEIERIPTINRSLTDFTRLTPQFAPSGSGSEAGTSVAGSSSRFNNIQIDGAAINDGFGLEQSGTPGGSSGTQPISLDAIQEFQVAISPYDVTQGNFSGGSINVVTKSGTNRFTGSGYYLGRNQDFVGDFDDQSFDDFGEFTTGATLGGPLVKDKLFFFVSGEAVRRDAPIVAGFLDAPAATTFEANRSSVQEVLDILDAQYGRDAGSIDQFDQQTVSNKLFARVDYNVNPSNNATLRFNYVKGQLDDGIFRDRTNSFQLEDRYYKRENTNTSTVFELNSLFGARYANQFRASLQTNRQPSTLQFAPFPSVDINGVGDGDIIAPGDTSSGGRVSLGPDQFRGANNIDADVFELTNNFNIFAGDHVITLGTQNTYQSFANLFIRNFYGYYSFDSVADFRAGTPSSYERNYSAIEGEDRPLAEFSNWLVGFYAQDEWKVNNQLTVNLGLRLDIPFYPDSPSKAGNGLSQSDLVVLRDAGLTPTQIEAVPGRSFEDIFGFDNSETPGGNVIVSPRFGFNYAIDPERNTQVRGGAGVFAGRFPSVWISNSFSNDGSLLGGVSVRSESAIANAGGFRFDPDNQYTARDFGLSEGSAEINLTDPDFKNPTNFRTNFALDQSLGGGLVATAEVIYTKVIDAMQWKELNRQPFALDPTTVDGRSRQRRATISDDYQSVILLTNTDEGYTTNATVQLQKKINQGFLPDAFFSLSYTNSTAKDINSVTSSQARSNVRDLAVGLDVNDPPLATSNFELKHRLLATASYRLAYADRFATTGTLLYDGRSGNPVSYIYARSDANGDGFDRGDLAFIPASRDQVEMTDADWEALQSLIGSRDALQDAQGGIFERNTDRGPWQNFLDFSLRQEVRTVAGQRFEVSWDVENVLSLLGLDAGEVEFIDGNVELARFRGYTTDGRARLDRVASADRLVQKADFGSRWRMQLGVKYIF